MKRFVSILTFIFATTGAIILNSCDKYEAGVETKKEDSKGVFKDSNPGGFVILQVTKGKKVEVNGHKECEGNKKTCWLWFPTENANNNAYVIKNQNDELEITLYLSSLSSTEIQKWTEDISNGYIDLTDDVLVENSAFLNLIDEDYPIIIESGIYNIIINVKDNNISFTLPFVRN